MQSFDADFGEGAPFVTLCCRMIYFPKSHTWEFLMQFETKRVKTCANYDDL